MISSPKPNDTEVTWLVCGHTMWRLRKYPSIHWFKGKITGKSNISWENLWFPVDFPLNQPIESHAIPMKCAVGRSARCQGHGLAPSFSDRVRASSVSGPLLYLRLQLWLQWTIVCRTISAQGFNTSMLYHWIHVHYNRLFEYVYLQWDIMHDIMHLIETILCELPC